MLKAITPLDPDFLISLSRKGRNGSAHWSIGGNSGKLQFDFVAIQPHTYVRPHCHPGASFFGPTGSQFLIVLKGKLALILIDPKTGEMSRSVLDSAGGDRAVEVPGGIYHSSAALKADTVIMEVVEPGIKKRYLAGSPLPGTAEADELIKLWTRSLKGPFKSPLLKIG